MKNPKKLTYAQKQQVSKAGLDPSNFMLKSASGNRLELVSKDLKETKILEGMKIVSE